MLELNLGNQTIFLSNITHAALSFQAERGICFSRYPVEQADSSGRQKDLILFGKLKAGPRNDVQEGLAVNP